jgi:hypothetical protein
MLSTRSITFMYAPILAWLISTVITSNVDEAKKERRLYK